MSQLQRPTDRERRWLAHMACHGPQSSQFLHELTRDTHRCKDTALRNMQSLRVAGYLRRPVQQEQITKANFNPHVYDLTRHSTRYLRGLGHADPVRPTGHWWHAFLTACVTSAVAIAANQRGYRYIPAHDILNRSGASLAIPMGRQRLIPDQLFALDYGGAFRSFVLEVDRGTEPNQSSTARKSLQRMIGQYAKLVSTDGLRQHYALKSPLLILMVFTSPERAARCLEYVEAEAGACAQYMLVATVPAEFPRWVPVQTVISAAWARARDIPPLSLFP